MTTRVTPRQRAGLLVGLSYIAFISLGLPDGLIGVGWPSIRATFGLPIDALGALLITFTSGYLLSSTWSGWALARFGVGMLLVLSCLSTSLSLIGYGLAPGWWAMVALGFFSGLGAGAIDAGLNTYAANHFDARIMNWLHAFFGVGAASGPLVMTAVLGSGQSWRLGFLLVGVVQMGLALCFWLTRARWDGNGAQASISEEQRAAPASATLRLPAVWLSIALFVVYTGTEMAVGQWSFSLLTESRGVATVTAGVVVSAYWWSLTIGRVVFGGLAGSTIPLATLLRGCFMAVILGAVCVWLNAAPWLNFGGIALMGFALAPIFPSLISTTPARLGPLHTANAVGFQIAAASLGGAALPALVGVLARNFGLEVLGPFLFVAALLVFGLFEMLERGVMLRGEG